MAQGEINTLCNIFIKDSSHHGGQYNEEDENSALLVKFRNTMRDGGWRKPAKSTIKDFSRPSQIKAHK